MKLIRCLSILFYLFTESAQSLDYVYSIGTDDKEPLKIVPIEQVDPSKPYMKDPLPPDVKLNTKVGKVVKLPKNKLKITPAHLTLKKMTVRGNYSKPRIEFEREPLPLGRVFEPMDVNFINKVQNQDPTD